jgi:uncharacterized protein (DUF302 family)
MTCFESCYSVGTTMDRLEAHVKSRGAAIAQRVDHAAAAKKAGLELRPTEVVIFGNPEVGTQLMRSRQGAALDLPLRVTAWQDERGNVRVGWRDPSRIAKLFGITGRDQAVAAMRESITKAIGHSAAPY